MAEAAAVNDGKIVFVGTLEDVKEYAGPLTIVHDYGENVIYPGFIDHFFKTGLADKKCRAACAAASFQPEGPK